VNQTNPVLTSMELRLGYLRERYHCQPSEHTRYQLVRYEQLLAQWVPSLSQAN
jgi:hypothetical protein